MYIYDLPFETNKELCRLLDFDDKWKKLAGDYMSYSAFDIIEIEQQSQRQAVSPTGQLFIRWGQANHRVEELFVLLYKMEHYPAINCLRPHVGERYLKLLNNKKTRNGSVGRDRSTLNIDANGNNDSLPVVSSQSDLPLPVMLVERGGIPTFTKSVAHDITGPTSSIDGTSSIQDSSHDTVSFSAVPSIPLSTMSIRMIPYEELKMATDNWADANLLGRGGFGHVFKGELNFLKVAVKRLANNDTKNRELIREMLVNKCRHDNIMALYAYSIGGPEACLVYQLMAGGSLEQRLKCKTHYPPLSWCQRHRIAHGVAAGLQFLHRITDDNKVSTPLIHGDIKPANILLDQCTIPKIGDFGLARKGPYGDGRSYLKVSSVHGTRPYLPDEYLITRCLSPAVDVFSFGVVLLEISTALPAIHSARAERLLSSHVLAYSRSGNDMATLEDRMLFGTQASNPQLCRSFIAVGIKCTEYNRHDRPTMFDVYKTLDVMNFPGKNVEY